MEHEHEHVIFAYTLAEAIDDGVLQQLGWAQGKPLMGTAGLCRMCPRVSGKDCFRTFSGGSRRPSRDWPKKTAWLWQPPAMGRRCG